MRINYDNESGAFTIYLREDKPDHAEDFSKEADVYLDVHSGAPQGTDGQTVGQAQRREGLAPPQASREKELTCSYLAPKD